MLLVCAEWIFWSRVLFSSSDAFDWRVFWGVTSLKSAFLVDSYHNFVCAWWKLSRAAQKCCSTHKGIPKQQKKRAGAKRHQTNLENSLSTPDRIYSLRKSNKLKKRRTQPKETKTRAGLFNNALLAQAFITPFPYEQQQKVFSTLYGAWQNYSADAHTHTCCIIYMAWWRYQKQRKRSVLRTEQGCVVDYGGL